MASIFSPQPQGLTPHQSFRSASHLRPSFAPRNRSLQMDFTLEPADAQWVQDTIVKATAELRSTALNGPAISDTVSIILEREKNRVKWKNDLCAHFDREPWSAEVDGKKVGLEEATKELRVKRRDEPEEWQWSHGSQPLSEIWEMGYRDLFDLQNPFQVGDVKDFVKKIKQEDARIEMRKKTLARNAERIAQARAKAAAQAPPPPMEAPTPSQDLPMTSAEPVCYPDWDCHRRLSGTRALMRSWVRWENGQSSAL